MPQSYKTLSLSNNAHKASLILEIFIFFFLFFILAVYDYCFFKQFYVVVAFLTTIKITQYTPPNLEQIFFEPQCSPTT